MLQYLMHKISEQQRMLKINKKRSEQQRKLKINKKEDRVNIRES